MKKELLEKSILETLPQVSFIVDQVGLALKFAEEGLSENDYLKTLESTLKVAQYTAQVSNMSFYKYHLVIASLICDLPDVMEGEKYDVFRTASKSIENTVLKTRVSKELTEKRGCFNALSLHLAAVSRENQDYFASMLCHILADLEDVTKGMKAAGVKSPITPSDYITILGYSYVIQNIAGEPSITGRSHDLINEIRIILNELAF